MKRKTKELFFAIQEKLKGQDRAFFCILKGQEVQTLTVQIFFLSLFLPFLCPFKKKPSFFMTLFIRKM